MNGSGNVGIRPRLPRSEQKPQHDHRRNAAQDDRAHFQADKSGQTGEE